MLVNLSDVLTSEGNNMNLEIPLEMTEFDGGTGVFEITEKSPVILKISNVEADKAKIEGKVKVIFRTACDRCLAEVPTSLDLEFERLVTSPEIASEDEAVDDLSFMEGYQLNVDRAHTFFQDSSEFLRSSSSDLSGPIPLPAAVLSVYRVPSTKKRKRS